MRELAPPSAIRWLSVGTELIRAQVLTGVHFWTGHFDFPQRRKVRCSGIDCPYCNAGRLPEVYYVVGLMHHRLGRCLFELRARHYQVACQLNEHESEGVGCWLEVSRSGTARNSPIEVSLVKWEPAEEWDISRLVDSLGLAQSREIPNSDSGELAGATSGKQENGTEH